MCLVINGPKGTRRCTDRLVPGGPFFEVNMETIVVAGNGPSAQALGVEMRRSSICVMRVNYFFLPDHDALDYACTDWFICQHDRGDLRNVIAYTRHMPDKPTIWIPGIETRGSLPIEEIRKQLPGFTVRVQREFGRLPAACRWERDLAPQRPLMGSYALAVAVGMQPDRIVACGMDLFAGTEGGSFQGGTTSDTRGEWQNQFAVEYRENRHRNHTLRGDIKYIGAALDAYKGELICYGAEMKRLFAERYKEREWRFI